MEDDIYIDEYLEPNDKVQLYLITCELKKQLTIRKGDIIGIGMYNIDKEKYHKTKYGLIKEAIILDKLNLASNSDLFNAEKIYNESKNVIKAIECISSFKWGRK